MAGVPLLPSHGFSSLTFLYESANYILSTDKSQVKILYIGDYDPHGVLIPRKIEEGLRTHLDGICDVELKRLAINKEQIAQYDLPTKPAKQVQIKSTGIAVEVEAMPIENLRQLLRRELNQYVTEARLERQQLIDSEERMGMHTLGMIVSEHGLDDTLSKLEIPAG